MEPPHSKDQRSLEPEPAAVDLRCAPPGCSLPGRTPPPLELAAEAGSAKQRSATSPIQLRLSLVMARDCTEAQIANAQQSLRILSSDPALSAARLTIRDCLKEAAAQSGETAEELSAECSKRVTARMSADDAAAMIELLRKANAQ